MICGRALIGGSGCGSGDDGGGGSAMNGGDFGPGMGKLGSGRLWGHRPIGGIGWVSGPPGAGSAISGGDFDTGVAIAAS